LYIGDSLGANRPGRSTSEKIIGNNLDQLIRETKSRMVIATFASNVGRMIQVINSAIKYNKVVFLSGRSMVNNVEICQELGYINVPKGYIRKLTAEVETLPDERVLILSTGAQGEEFAGLTRMARGEHPMIQLRKGDTVLMSATAIPGNEIAVSSMINELIIKGVNVITRDDIDIHAS
jgi:beta-lactamase domain protein